LTTKFNLELTKEPNNVIVASKSIADTRTWQLFHSLKMKTFMNKTIVENNSKTNKASLTNQANSPELYIC